MGFGKGHRLYPHAVAVQKHRSSLLVYHLSRQIYHQGNLMHLVSHLILPPKVFKLLHMQVQGANMCTTCFLAFIYDFQRVHYMKLRTQVKSIQVLGLFKMHDTMFWIGYNVQRIWFTCTCSVM